MYFFQQIRWVRHVLICILLFTLGFAWNAHYADSRLQNILAQELEGEELSVEGRVVGLPQGGEAGAKFAFEITKMFLKGESKAQFPHQIYLSWQPVWRSHQIIPEIIPGQRWNLKVKLKRPYGSLNTYTFDFERWSFHQNFGASGSVKSGKLLRTNDIGIFELRCKWN